ncbi:C4-dicarboxylate transporter/malic acid transporter [Rhizoctonia solani AG-3 Rhs1AP]|uniref:C4-dicarboxylate transporter/malic acid transporter n=2 Tax=Rhizoctonia solani AG-3 TaxID=1086053 RepID=A0A074S5T3_9AGAM|nr:C4-dicarboxylate transporter/malic acid transporter [Rhizoctonia solani AG-3 Rhs1AP]KEP52213.1 C4-dicarboxylate transporter/malic acid transporter [Rhizoctonia solani 123E]
MVRTKPLSHQADEEESQLHYAVTHSIKNFTPAWFSVNMGTGAVSVLLHNFPYGSRPVLHGFGVALLILNVCLFGLFCVLSAIRYIRYPEILRLMYKHPVQSLYLGCFPMGFATLINASLNAYQAYKLSDSFLYLLWGLWWLDTIVALAVYFLMLYIMITRQNHSLKALTAVWLLPAVTPIVPATTGALLARAILPFSSNHATITLFVASTLLFLGLGLTSMILPLYMLRLITEGLPPNTMIISKFLPVGPCGQGGMAFVVIGQVFAEMAKQETSKNPLLAAPQPWIIVGVCSGFFLWTFGIWWILLSLVAMFETFRSQPPKFAVGFWGMVFPSGVYTLLTWQLAEMFNSAFFRVLSAILSVSVFILWATLTVTTIYQIHQNHELLFNAPCLDSCSDLGTTPVGVCRKDQTASKDDNC